MQKISASVSGEKYNQARGLLKLLNKLDIAHTSSIKFYNAAFSKTIWGTESQVIITWKEREHVR